MAIGAHVAPRSIFARKNYFYPDASKNYQLTQYDKPSTANGYVEFRSELPKSNVGKILRKDLRDQDLKKGQSQNAQNR